MLEIKNIKQQIDDIITEYINLQIEINDATISHYELSDQKNKRFNEIENFLSNYIKQEITLMS